jgi:tRNA G18 (ribose-2'-O)-methylase SpoU
MKLNARELRTQPVDDIVAHSIKKNPIIIILDNILDTYNIGSIFRLADAVAAEKVYLCGVTETPPNTRIKKASINTCIWLKWHYTKTTIDAIVDIRKNYPDVQIIAVEQDKKSVPFGSVIYHTPVAIIVGNESYGMTQDVLDQVDTIVELPMFGINTSLNVMVSCGIVLYDIVKKLFPPQS